MIGYADGDSLFDSEKRLSLEGRKCAGAYYTPDFVVRSLVSWATRHAHDRLLDPACGDGRFLMAHPGSVGVEQDDAACAVVHQRAPGSLLHQGDFFEWAANTSERFDCAAGNPPFIRYQRFTGATRDGAIRLCRRLGAEFSGLTSSWAPFLVATAGLLRPNGRMAFVVPAEIGHAPYAVPLVSYLTRRFATVHVVAVKEKFFPRISEDCWLLYADGFGRSCSQIRFSAIDRFQFMRRPPRAGISIGLDEWNRWNKRLRPFLLSQHSRQIYLERCASEWASPLGTLATVGIGYVTGANDFFHLRPSIARRLGIPKAFLRPSVRSGRVLGEGEISRTRVRKWIEDDEQVLLLRIRDAALIPAPVRSYLDSVEGKVARGAYKCRMRDPWYVVPDVKAPDAFVSYMSGSSPAIAANTARCVCTNTVHAVELKGKMSLASLVCRWSDPLVSLSCEIEGHPLGGGMLKLEPREASNVLIPRRRTSSPEEQETLVSSTNHLRAWRHYAV